MDPVRFTTIAHRDHVFCSPLFGAKVDRVLGMLAIAPGDRVLEVGCGKGEVLVRLLERLRVSAMGVDPNPAFLEEARGRAAARAPGAALELIAAKASDAGLRREFRLGIAIGATHAFGGYRETLRALRDLVVPGGWVLVGEGYWKCDPDPGYLSLLGSTPAEFTDHEGNARVALEEGLAPLEACESTDAEWDHYEDTYAQAVRRHLAEHPDDPDRDAMRERIERWRDGYLRWGRQTLGFGLYLFRT